MLLKLRFLLIAGVLALGILHGVPAAGADTQNNQAAKDDDTATVVICNVIRFVQKLGLPIMTGVILGSSIMAIFGKLAWPAIVMLVVFTAIFFGAGKLMAKFAKGLVVCRAKEVRMPVTLTVPNISRETQAVMVQRWWHWLG